MLFFWALLFSLSVFSQDTIKTSPFYWEFEFNYCNFLNTPHMYSNNFNKSRGAAINLKYGFKINNFISIIPGINYTSNIISSNIGFYKNGEITEINILENGYQDNIFTFNSVNIPIIFQFKTKPQIKNIYLAYEIGIKSGFLIFNKYSLSTKNDNIINTISEINNKNINPSQYSVVNQINLRKCKISNNQKVGLSVFLRYEQSLSKLFKQNEGPNFKYNNLGFGLGFIFE